MTARARRFMRDRAGATALEFAIVAPVLILLLIGIFNVGYAMYCGAAVRNAIQRAARVLILTPATPASTISSAAQALLADVPVNDLAVSVTTETVSSSMQVERVSWTYDYVLSVPFSNTSTLSFGSSMVVPMTPTN